MLLSPGVPVQRQPTEFASDIFKKLRQPVKKDCGFRVLVSRLNTAGWCVVCRGRKWRRADRGQIKSALDFSVKDASAALPQNCQTTKWILSGPPFCVNVTLVTRFSQS
jgi:hypothetical protein